MFDELLEKFQNAANVTVIIGGAILGLIGIKIAKRKRDDDDDSEGRRIAAATADAARDAAERELDRRFTILEMRLQQAFEKSLSQTRTTFFDEIKDRDDRAARCTDELKETLHRIETDVAVLKSRRHRA